MNTPINHLTAGFIGLGLIGGSIARGLKRSAPDIRIMAYMRTRKKLEQAHADGMVDLILDGVDEHLGECDIIFLHDLDLGYGAGVFLPVRHRQRHDRLRCVPLQGRGRGGRGPAHGPAGARRWW